MSFLLVPFTFLFTQRKADNSVITLAAWSSSKAFAQSAVNCSVCDVAIKSESMEINHTFTQIHPVFQLYTVSSFSTLWLPLPESQSAWVTWPPQSVWAWTGTCSLWTGFPIPAAADWWRLSWVSYTSPTNLHGLELRGENRQYLFESYLVLMILWVKRNASSNKSPQNLPFWFHCLDPIALAA